MKEVADRLNRQFTELLRGQLPIDFRIPLHEIEQVVCVGEGRRMSPPPGRDWLPGEPKNGVILHSVLIRMTRDLDWPALPRAVAAALKIEVREVRPNLFRCTSDVMPVFFFIPDRRTICVLGFDLPPTYDRYDELLERMKPAGTAGALLGPAWSKVERSALAIAVDNRKGYWTHEGVSSPEGDKVVEMLGHPTHFVAGLDVADTVIGRAFVTGSDEATTEKTLQGIKALVTLGQVTLKVAPADDDAGRFLLKVYGELLGDSSVRREGTTVAAEFRSPTRWVDLSKLLDVGDLTGK
jgi:hypothetical protein